MLCQNHNMLVPQPATRLTCTGVHLSLLLFSASLLPLARFNFSVLLHAGLQVGLQPVASKFFIFTTFMTLCQFAATSLALMVSAVCRTTDLSVVVLPMYLEVGVSQRTSLCCDP